MRRNVALSPALAVAAGAALAVAQTSGTVNVLAMNVAGLPAILQGNDVPGDKTENHRTIGRKLVEYGLDLVNVQEDFNYHAALYETATLPYRTATSGGVPFGSGLNTLSVFPFLDETRVKWDQCSSTDGADCLTPKGFTLVRAELTSGSAGSAFVDFYNVHADAGTTAADLAARTSNIRQLSAYITANSAGNAVIVAGDTNTRYTRSGDNIRLLPQANGLTDAWVELIRGGADPTVETICQNPSLTNYCETVDKIFYRSSPVLNLRATGWQYESARFLQADGNILSDHNPVAANFTWSLPSTLRQSSFLGGPHGTWFSDADALAARSSKRVASIRLRGGSRLDSVAVTLADGIALSHGGSGGSLSELQLAAGETWASATICQGKYNNRTRIFFVEARTSTGRTAAAGARTSECAQYSAPQGWGILGFVGRSGDEVDRLGFLYAPQ
jgi:endonuclease/exonuclease/phosphatase (EEP) superfamily protein YafD